MIHLLRPPSPGLARALQFASPNITRVLKCPTCNLAVTRPSVRHSRLLGTLTKPRTIRLPVSSVSDNGLNRCIPSQSHKLWTLRAQDDLTKALSDAEKHVGYPTSFLSLRCLLSDELSNVAMYMKQLVGSRHPLVKTARGFVYDGQHSMQTRGLLVLLVAKAAAPCLPSNTVAMEQEAVSGIYPGQRQLAEITEMIHTAYLIHNGVVDLSAISESEFKDMEFGNKMSVLTGDFLLANACTSLAQLDNTEVVGMISTVIGHLMEGEVMNCEYGMDNLTMEYWRQLVFLCKGSLLASSCQAVLKLMSHSRQLLEKAYEFGKNIAYAHHLKEELQNLREKQTAINLNSTAVILTLHNKPVKDLLQQLVHIKDRDTEAYQKLNKTLLQRVVDYNGTGLVETLLSDYSQAALTALIDFPPSETKQALENIIHTVSP